MEPLAPFRQIARGTVRHQLLYQAAQVLFVVRRLFELRGQLLLDLFQSPAGRSEPERGNTLHRDQYSAALLQIFQLHQLLSRRCSILSESAVNAMSHSGIEDGLARDGKPGTSRLP